MEGVTPSTLHHVRCQAPISQLKGFFPSLSLSINESIQPNARAYISFLRATKTPDSTTHVTKEKSRRLELYRKKPGQSNFFSKNPVTLLVHEVGRRALRPLLTLTYESIQVNTVNILSGTKRLSFDITNFTEHCPMSSFVTSD